MMNRKGQGRNKSWPNQGFLSVHVSAKMSSVTAEIRNLHHPRRPLLKHSIFLSLSLVFVQWRYVTFSLPYITYFTGVCFGK
jgi:hypothetical protein